MSEIITSYHIKISCQVSQMEMAITHLTTWGVEQINSYFKLNKIHY